MFKPVANKVDWWEFIQKGRTYRVQWTHRGGGWVRARLDSITPWKYKPCGNAFNALSIGLGIIQRQKEKKSPPC